MIIYKVENKVNGKIYIGKTINSLEKRKWRHLNDSKKEKYNSIYFYRALKKYGEENFEWSILSTTDSENKLNVMEKFYIAVYRKMNQLYNMTNGGEGMSGYIMPQKTKEKISLSNMNHVVSDYTKNRIKEKRKLQICTEETKNKMSKNRKGRKHNKESKLKMSKIKKSYWENIDKTNYVFSREGKAHSEETKEKIRQKALERELKTCPYCNKKMSPGNLKKWHGEKCKKFIIPE